MRISLVQSQEAVANIAGAFDGESERVLKLFVESISHSTRIPTNFAVVNGESALIVLHLPISTFDGVDSFSRLYVLRNGNHLQLFAVGTDEEKSAWSGLESVTSDWYAESGRDRKEFVILSWVVGEISNSISAHESMIKPLVNVFGLGNQRHARRTRTSKLDRDLKTLLISRSELQGLAKLSESLLDVVAALSASNKGTSQASSRASGSTEDISSLEGELLRIEVEQIWRHAVMVMEEIDLLLESLTKMQAGAQARAGQFLAAVATLAGTPLVFLALFSQLFAEGKRFSSENSVTGLLLATGVVFIIEFVYFARKRWI